MTKFVAVLFLPMVLGVSTLLFSAIRRRLFARLASLGRGDRVDGAHLRALVRLRAVAIRLAASGKRCCRSTSTIASRRSSTRPTCIPGTTTRAACIDGFGDSGSAELAIAGLALLVVETVRRRWFEGFLVLCWLVLPIALMSAGTSKLYHYAYPFVPPVALAVGHLAALGFTLAPLVLNTALRWVDRALIAPRARLVAALERPAVRTTLQAVASLALAIGGREPDLRADPPRVGVRRCYFRSSGVLRPAIVALVCGVLAGARRSTSLAVGAILVASLLPLPAYRATLTRLTVEQHPMRTTTDCLQTVDRTLSGAAAPGLYVDLPQDVADSWDELLFPSCPSVDRARRRSRPRRLTRFSPTRRSGGPFSCTTRPIRSSCTAPETAPAFAPSRRRWSAFRTSSCSSPARMQLCRRDRDPRPGTTALQPQHLMAGPLTLSIVIPAYNEEKRLAATLETVSAFLVQQPWTWEVRVVDDGSADDTVRVAEQFSAAEPRIVVQREPHRGKGGAVKAGLQAATGAYRFICDADLSMPIAEVRRFLPPLLSGFDLAIGIP